MRINVEGGALPPTYAPRVGNVYPARGGKAGSRQWLYVLIAMSEQDRLYGVTCYFLTVTREGSPVGVTQFGLHHVETMEPVAFVEGLEDLDLTMRMIP